MLGFGAILDHLLIESKNSLSSRKSNSYLFLESEPKKTDPRILDTD